MEGVKKMTNKLTLLSRGFAVLVGVLRVVGMGLLRGARAVLRGLREFILISGSYPSLTRDPGIAAYRLLEGHRRRSRPFRQPAISLRAGSLPAGEPHLQFSAFL